MTANKDKTVIVEGKGEAAAIQARVKQTISTAREMCATGRCASVALTSEVRSTAELVRGATDRAVVLLPRSPP